MLPSFSHISIITLLTLISIIQGFGGGIKNTNFRTNAALFSTAAENETQVKIDPKEAVKVFGRLAEKYIMLDGSAGQCCYSGCSNCEFRLPGGGYRMADQSAARPKWIPCYEERLQGEGENVKQHVSKWSSIFEEGPSVNKSEFIERVLALDYAPTLGGPYTAASQASIADTSVIATLFDILSKQDGSSEEEKPLTKFYMAKRMKEIAGDDQESLTWQSFVNMFAKQ